MLRLPEMPGSKLCYRIFRTQPPLRPTGRNSSKEPLQNPNPQPVPYSWGSTLTSGAATKASDD
jgi:hypothetical protein